MKVFRSPFKFKLIIIWQSWQRRHLRFSRFLRVMVMHYWRAAQEEQVGGRGASELVLNKWLHAYRQVQLRVMLSHSGTAQEIGLNIPNACAERETACHPGHSGREHFTQGTVVGSTSPGAQWSGSTSPGAQWSGSTSPGAQWSRVGALHPGHSRVGEPHPWHSRVQIICFLKILIFYLTTKVIFNPSQFLDTHM